MVDSRVDGKITGRTMQTSADNVQKEFSNEVPIDLAKIKVSQFLQTLLILILILLVKQNHVCTLGRGSSFANQSRFARFQDVGNSNMLTKDTSSSIKHECRLLSTLCVGDCTSRALTPGWTFPSRALDEGMRARGCMGVLGWWSQLGQCKELFHADQIEANRGLRGVRTARLALMPTVASGTENVQIKGFGLLRFFGLAGNRI